MDGQKMHCVDSGNHSKRFEVQLSQDLVYGTGAVAAPSGGVALRDLKLDLYRPITNDARPLPVLILAFGGAFHRGTKEDDAFGDAPNRNNSIAWYCHEFARRGYAACSIDYRLIPEDPRPGDTPVINDPGNIPRSRVDQVREIMNLPKASDALLWRGIEAASDDMAQAVRYIKARAQEWNIDSDKIAIGGFSAGARTALNVALGEREAVAAVVALSGYMHASDMERHLACAHPFPPLLLIHAEHDLDYVRDHHFCMVKRLRERGLHCESVQVPGATHFYSAQAPARHDAYGITTVEAAIAGFLSRALSAVPSLAAAGLQGDIGPSDQLGHNGQ